MFAFPSPSPSLWEGNYVPPPSWEVRWGRILQLITTSEHKTKKEQPEAAPFFALAGNDYLLKFLSADTTLTQFTH